MVSHRRGRLGTCALGVALLAAGLRSTPPGHLQPGAPTPRRPYLVGTLGAGLVSLQQAAPAGALFGLGDIPAPDDAYAIPADAERGKGGLAWKVLQAPSCSGSDCERPLPYDMVEVDYTGWQAKDGKMFDSSVQRGRHASFGVGQVIRGWTQGLQLMAVGEKRRFWIPAKLAYGDVPSNPMRPAGDLVFDVELYSIERGPVPPPPPPDVAAIPADATVTESGLAFKKLSPGKKGFESRTPGPVSRVKVEYSGWQTNGELFISTKVSGKPAEFTVQDIALKGLAEGIQLMTLGESRRFWLPSKLAYGDKPKGNVPGGMLVFDVTLTAFQ